MENTGDGYYPFLAMMATVCLISLVCSWLCGYVVGRCYVKPIYVDKPIYIEKVVEKHVPIEWCQSPRSYSQMSHASETTKKDEEMPKQRRLEYIDQVWIAQSGKCYHLSGQCKSLVNCKGVISKRSCLICAGRG